MFRFKPQDLLAGFVVGGVPEVEECLAEGIFHGLVDLGP